MELAPYLRETAPHKTSPNRGVSRRGHESGGSSLSQAAADRAGREGKEGGRTAPRWSAGWALGWWGEGRAGDRRASRRSTAQLLSSAGSWQQTARGVHMHASSRTSSSVGQGPWRCVANASPGITASAVLGQAPVMRLCPVAVSEDQEFGNSPLFLLSRRVCGGQTSSLTVGGGGRLRGRVGCVRPATRSLPSRASPGTCPFVFYVSNYVGTKSFTELSWNSAPPRLDPSH